MKPSIEETSAASAVRLRLLPNGAILLPTHPPLEWLEVPGTPVEFDQLPL